MSIALDGKQTPMSEPARINIEKMSPGGLFVGLIGVVITVGILLASNGSTKTAIAGSYLFAWVFWFSLTLGCFGLLMLYHLIRGTYLLPQYRILESAGGARMLLIMAILFLPVVVPVFLGQSYLYEWVDPALRSTNAILQHKAPYLNTNFWTLRYLFWFSTWIYIAWWFKNSTDRQERTGDLNELKKRNNRGGPAFVWFALSATFSMVDWVMSIDWRWYPDMFGLWTIIQMGLGAYAFTVFIVCSNAKTETYKPIVNAKRTRDFGVILFVFVMLWAYTSFSQFLIIWSGNLPDSNFYYVERSKSNWNVVGLMAMMGQYFIPFVALLTPRNRKIPQSLAIVAGFMVVMHLVDVYQYVLPAIRHSGPMPTGWDVLAFFSVGLLWTGAVAAFLKQRPILQSFDLRLQEDNGGH